MIWLLLSCREPLWTHEGAFAPHLARLDRDHDGAVRAAEYQAVAYSAPSFTAADRDGSGTFDVDELEALTDAQDPLRFDQSPPHQPPAPTAGTTLTAEQRWIWELLQVLRDEAPHGPDDLQIEAAVRSGSLGSEGARPAMERLRASWSAAGLQLPPSVEASSAPPR